MSKSSTYHSEDVSGPPQPTYDPNPPTVAAFSPTTLSGSSIASKQRSTIIVHKKSPLLVATPPQITRALAYSHPFFLPLNHFVGLVSWSTDDPWASFLLVAGFWAVTLYGSHVIEYAGPLIVVVLLILGMYSRRFSPLSSTSRTGEKHSNGSNAETLQSSPTHHKSLDEIVETLREFTTRCNLLLDPFLQMTDFLSIQRTPTSATTRPALTTLFVRILLVTPFWLILTLPPLGVLTTRRVILTIGTIVLTWHSRPARVSRVILWRSLLIRRFCSILTGLNFSIPNATPSDNPASDLKPPPLPRRPSQQTLASQMASGNSHRALSTGVRFTFILYENQRRWIGLGWTTSLFAYERGPWTDEHFNPAPSRDDFELPEVEGGTSKWRWVDQSAWRIDYGPVKGHSRSTSEDVTGHKSSKDKSDGDDGGGWIFYDNKWNDGRREDGWGRYTRRRKWYRDAELVEVTPNTSVTRTRAPTAAGSQGHSENTRPAVDFERNNNSPAMSNATPLGKTTTATATDTEDRASVKSRESWFNKASKPPSTLTRESQLQKAKEKEKAVTGKQRSDSKSSSGKNTGHFSGRSDWSRDGPEDDHLDKWRDREKSVASGGTGAWGVAEDVGMGLS